MFCSHCGSEVKSCFKFCVKCGNPTSQNSDDHSSGCETKSHINRPGCSGTYLGTSDATSSKESVPKLDTFMKKKKDERMSHFKRKNKKLKNEKDEPVTINIGIMRYVEEESILKPQRGKSLPIRLPKAADSNEVLKLAVAKQSLHNGNEIVHNSVKSYKLLYPDGTEVKRLKESDEAFSLQGYKTELGKPFNRLTLYLCGSSEYFDYTLKGLGDVISNGSASECDSDQDLEELGEPIQSKITKYTHPSSAALNTETLPSDSSGPLPITTSSVSGGISVHECNASRRVVQYTRTDTTRVIAFSFLHDPFDSYGS